MGSKRKGGSCKDETGGREGVSHEKKVVSSWRWVYLLPWEGGVVCWGQKQDSRSTKKQF